MAAATKPAAGAQGASEGISLARYAAVRAAVTEGFPLADVLAVEGLLPRTFARADLAWKQRLAAEPELLAAYEQELAQAEDWLDRQVEPLASDPAAWVSFLAAFGAHPAPFELLQERDLGMNDVARLRRRWARRAEEDAKVGELLKELHAEPGKLGSLRAGPRVLRPSRMAEARGSAASSAPTVPSSEAMAGPGAPLVAPAALHGTGPLLDVPRGAAVPFVPVHAELATGKAEPKPPRAAASLTGTAPLPGVPRGPELPFPRSGAAKAVKRPPPEIAETAPLSDIPRGPALPFTAGPSGTSASSPPTARPQQPRAPREVAETSPVQAPPRGPVIPFAAADPTRRAGALAASKPAPPAAAELRETSLNLAIPRELLTQAASTPATVTGAALRTAKASPPSAPSSTAGEGGTAPLPEPLEMLLPLATYAALCAELALSPATAEEIFRGYGLGSSEMRSAVDAAWKERLRGNPAEYSRWQDMVQRYYAHFARRGAPPR
ncbi:hypothetical protein WMF20_35180 [Sorangium sp. So ce834]|uniref:hypothetical protein n=1 Tax=Sorangium sp. So ce834 TaxID=3133321 RepID=UPI003F60594B